MAAQDGVVQVSPDGGGKRVRNIAVQALQPDGSIQTVYQQAVTIVDALTGQALDVVNDERWRSDVTQLLRAMVRGIAILAETTEDELLCEDDSDL